MCGVRIIGERQALDPDIGRLLTEAEELTKTNDGLTLVVAFNYGARQEITRAARRIAQQVADGKLAPSDITTETVGGFLDAPDLPVSRLDHPNQRRAAPVELPAVAVGL